MSNQAAFIVNSTPGMSPDDEVTGKEEILIEGVKDHRSIWCRTDKTYQDSIMKNNVLVNVAKIADLSDEEAFRKKWNYLYSSFRRVQAPRKSGFGGAYKPDWKFLKAMSYVRKFIKYRKSRRNVPPGDSDDANKKMPIVSALEVGDTQKPAGTPNEVTQQFHPICGSQGKRSAHLCDA